MARLWPACNYWGVTLAFALFAPDVPDEPTSWDDSARRRPGEARSDAVDIEERALLDRFRAGNTEAFHALYVAHYGVLRDVARGVVGTLDMAEDVVQQVFVELWERRADWHPRRIRPALIRAVRYRALDHWRRGRKFDGLDALSATPAQEQTDVTAERRELDRALAQALAELPERRRTALLLRVVRQLSYAEIGEALEISEKAAFVLVSRARATLEPIRQRFTEQLGDPK